MTKPAFLEQLRHALIEVGFLYLKNVGIPDELFSDVISQGKAFFEIPEEEKLKIEMKNAPSFLGYSRMDAEVTAGRIDHREQIDLSTQHPLPVPGKQPRYYNLRAPNQWPEHSLVPGFRPAFEKYMQCMGAVSMYFTSLIAEAIGLPPSAFERYFDGEGGKEQQHKLKIVKYPDGKDLGLKEGEQGQGVGPHKDSMLSSYLLQASEHRCLQVQNMRGEWVDVPPLKGTLVVAIGQGLEALTRGVCVSTTHRVLSPPAGTGPRFSIPFFQGVSGDARFEDLEGVGVGIIPEEVRELRMKVIEKNGGRRLDDVEFTFHGGGKAKTLGDATLRNRVKSHPDVGKRWYPDILEELTREAIVARKAY